MRFVQAMVLSALFVAACGEPDEVSSLSASFEPTLELRELDEFSREAARIPNLTAVETRSNAPGYLAYDLVLTLPTDHNAPSQQFTQRATLLFKSYDAPTVIMQTGYTLFEDQIDSFAGELAEVLDANQIVVEHRYFKDSRPIPADWSKLTVEQAAGDAHVLVQTLRPLLRGAWVGTGVSKGGMTTLFHHYFYPGDLDAVVPYVAPISFGQQDPSYGEHLDQIGTEACREALEDLQRQGIERIEFITDNILARSPQTDRVLLRDYILDTIASYSWSFWQNYGVEYCGDFPPPQLYSDDDLTNLFDVEPYWVGRQLPESDFDPYDFQTKNELGTPRFYSNRIDALMPADYRYGERRNPYLARPWGQDPSFDEDPMLDIYQWLKEDAQNVFAIYGQYDPWTGGRIELDQESSQVFVVPGASHGASLFGLPSDQRTDLYERITQASHIAIDLDNAGFNITTLSELSRQARILRHRDQAEVLSGERKTTLRFPTQLGN